MRLVVPAPHPKLPNKVLRPLACIACAGLLAGVLDISYILFVYEAAGVKSERLLQGVAYSVLGAATFTEGAASARVGLALHFGVALGAASLFYLAAQKVRFLVCRPVWGGILFGGLFYLLMNLIVLRFTRIPVSHFPPPGWSIDLFSHFFLVGIPIALVVGYFTPNKGR